MESSDVVLPFEFTVEGPPVSQQSRSLDRLKNWKDTVRQAAQLQWPPGAGPIDVPVQVTVVYYHDRPMVRLDSDNMVKPIQDALNGLVYLDDNQIIDTHVHRRDINGNFRVRHVSPVLAAAFSKGQEFIYVRIDFNQDPAELP